MGDVRDLAHELTPPNEMRSDSTGERNERLGNDPAQQNTGGESNPEDRALRESTPAPR